MPKKKTVNQYWSDFKMLYRRCNNRRVVNPNVCEEIRKVPSELLCTAISLESPVPCRRREAPSSRVHGTRDSARFVRSAQRGNLDVSWCGAAQ